ncbi:hypothetical protein GIB67_030668 [Kingdonia uniflora]|uniref:Non-haem dioxygenase N-terminal domain-containing protein n=1 Tax=Kingdonia uniflora TaxID=39325 RepID=A0A7J7NIF9_9MAGN|nr:hypothetical protein GIB67_030668 [Kingdonia uniflora]
MGHACETWSVFQITNHGVPMHLLEGVEFQGKRLFSLPAQQKLKAARSPDGIFGYGVARISSFVPKHLWSEGDIMEKYEKEVKELSAKLMLLILGSLRIAKEDHNRFGKVLGINFPVSDPLNQKSHDENLTVPTVKALGLVTAAPT